MQPYTWINSLDFKVSYGTQGNAGIGDYTALGLIGKTTSLNDKFSTTYVQPGNPNLTWETQKLLNIGVSGRLWNRFDFDISYYLRKTSNMLMSVPYPYTTGFSSMTSNVGELQNQGVDIKLGVDIVRGKDYFVNFGTTFNYNAMKVTKLFDGRQRWEVANTLTAYVVGKPVMFYLPLYAGVNKETGAPMWYKAGDNVDVTTKKETTENYNEAALTQNSGKKRFAPVNGGFNLSAGWKGITLQADFSYVLGKYLANNDAFFYNNPGAVSYQFNQKKNTADYWTEDNKNAKFPNWADGYVMDFDDHLLENASFLRLKNFQIGYELPKSVLAWQNALSGVKFTATARNLFTITNYSGVDPEVDSNLTYGKIGNSKQFLFGIELTF
ncbi:SusC/RagA family TonB-linked outer membrane protein [Prevotella sp.]